MNIIIVGAGKVGFNLAKTLSVGHNIIIIDKDKDILDEMKEQLDVLSIHGSGESVEIYKNFIDMKINLFIAVTNDDNINFISILMANKILDIDRRFIRLQDDIMDADILENDFGIEKIIFPNKLASEAIASLLKYPKSNNVKFFKYTSRILLSIKISKNISPQLVKSSNFLIVGVERGDEFFIPLSDNDCIVQPNDLLYMFGVEEDILDICNQLEVDNDRIDKCIIFGGNNLGIAIAKELLNFTNNIKLIEKSVARCHRADEKLEGRVSIINTKYRADSDIVENEMLDEADIFISALDKDEINIIKCLEAKNRGIKKVVAINNEISYYNLMHSLDIIVARGPKMSSYNKIIEEIGSTGVVIKKIFCGTKAIVFMRKVFKSSTLIDKTIKPISLKESIILYKRDNEMIKLEDKIKLKEEDLIISFATANESYTIEKWINGL